MSSVKEFNEYRVKMNERIMAQDNKVLKRFFSLDNQTYTEGALSLKTIRQVALSRRIRSHLVLTSFTHVLDNRHPQTTLPTTPSDLKDYSRE